MALNLKEVTEREEALRREITERQHLLHAYGQIRADLLGIPGSSWLPVAPPSPVAPALAQPDEAAPAAPDAPAARKVNPELAALRWGASAPRKAVAWAIAQMTDDYDLRDLAALLEREGYPLENAKISVILSRMKERGQIRQIARGSGRRGAIFQRRPGADDAVAGIADAGAATGLGEWPAPIA